MKTKKKESAIILMHCAVQKGLVAAVTNYLYHHRANILDLDQHVDREDQRFFMRVRWDLQGFQLLREDIAEDFQREIADRFGMQWQLYFGDQPLRMAIFVSKASHCLFDMLQRFSTAEWHVEIPLIISNHTHLQSIAERFDIPFHHLPVSRDTKPEQEDRIKKLLEKHNIDLIVLARYMQILTGDFVSSFPNRIINIHHSFLPAFVGAKPYHQAYERGVKIIGATSHYVTEDLDAGPIIAQDVVHISHDDRVTDLIRKGKDLEKIVLAKAIWHHINHNILPYKNRTVIFNK